MALKPSWAGTRGDRYDAFTLWNRLHGLTPSPTGRSLLAISSFHNCFGFEHFEPALWRCFAFLRNSDRHVAGALHHRRRQLASRFPYFISGACTTPLRWDWMTFIGTIGMFLAAMFLFLRLFARRCSIFEMRTLLPEAEVKAE